MVKELAKKYLDFELGEEQIEVLSQVFLCIDHKLPLITSITGPAGCGKTSLLKLIVEYLKLQNRPFLLASPTHKAKSVLLKNTDCPVTTVHSLLNLSPVLELLDFDLNTLQFQFKQNENEIPKNGVLIIDECSMINVELYDFITQKTIEKSCMIIFVGDKLQLRPVKETKISKTFSESYAFELTKIYRQENKNPVLDLLDKLRKGVIYDFKEFKSENGSLIKFNNWKDLIEQTTPLFKEAVETKNPNFVKLLAYTNKRVEAFNQVIRSQLFDDLQEYNVGDMLMAYDTKHDGSEQFINSYDYIVEETKQKTKKISSKTYLGWDLKLRSCFTNDLFSIFVLSKDNKIEDFQRLIVDLETVRLDAINTNKQNKYTYRNNWAKFYDTNNAFSTPIDLFLDDRLVKKKALDFAYCTTVHKAQGSSFDHLLVDMDNILLCRDQNELRQLQYVALSRTRRDIYMLIK